MKNTHNDNLFKRIVFGFMKMTISSRYEDSILGDLEEYYYDVKEEKGRFAAVAFMLFHVVAAFPELVLGYLSRSKDMFFNYLKIALRNLKRDKVHSIINISGLTVGIACSLLIYIFVSNELQYDSFHVYSDRLYRMWETEIIPNRETLQSRQTPFVLAPILKTEYPEVEHAIRYLTNTNVIKIGAESFTETVAFAEPGFFEMFTFPIVRGNSSEPLKDLNSVVLTEDAAMKFFGTTDAVSKDLTIEMGDKEYVFTVAAVAKDTPSNSTFQFTILLPFENTKNFMRSRQFTSWFSISGETYVLLKEGTSPDSFSEKMLALGLREFYRGEGDEYAELFIQPIRDMYLGESFGGGLGKNSDPMYSYILSIIGFFIVFIACVNFMTMSIGKSSKRAKEVGIRKVLGAVRGQLQKQYIGESLIICTISAVMGLGLAKIFLPGFNQLALMELELVFNSELAVALVSLILVISFAAGGYPAMVLSRFQPVAVLKNMIKFSNKSLLSKSLVLVQFSISIFLIIATFIMQNQMDLLRSKNLGFDKEQVITIRSNVAPIEASNVYERFKNEVSGSSQVMDITVSNEKFGERWLKLGFNDSDNKFRQFYANIVDKDYLKTMKIQLVAGRDFNPDESNDRTTAMIVNEAFLQYFGWTDHVGKKMPGNKFSEHTIIGVIKDFNYLSLHEDVEPLMLVLDQEVAMSGINDASGNNFPFMPRFYQVRMAPGDVRNSVDYLRGTWEKIAPETPFEYTFLDEAVNAQYENDERWSTIINTSSLLAIVIACLGLFGLAAVSVEQRVKEIGIRKILGSSLSEIILLLSKDLLFLVALANILAWPAAYYAMNIWLQDFASRVDLNVLWFFASGVFALLIAFATISYQTVRAGSANPVEALRYE